MKNNIPVKHAGCLLKGRAMLPEVDSDCLFLLHQSVAGAVFV